MHVQGWKHVDVAVGFVATNFWILLLSLLVCVTTHIVIKTLKRLLAPDFLRLSEKKLHSIQDLVNGGDLINQSQCLDMSSKLSKTIKNIQEVVLQCGSSIDLFKLSLENLYRLLVKAKLLVDDCSRKEWIAASVLQIQNENAFRVILLEVGLCYHVIYEHAKDMSEKWNFQLEDLRDSSTFLPAPLIDVDEDREILEMRLKDLVYQRYSSRLLALYHFVLDKIFKKLLLAQYLLVKLDCIPQEPHLEMLELPEKILWLEKAEPLWTWGRKTFLGSGAGASGVSMTSWLGIPCAKKFNIPGHIFLKEAGILYHANYPNIVKFICCGNGQEGGHFIAMELMEMSLSKLIQEQAKKKIPFSLHVAIDIMAQIARGMCYLHGMRVAHRDLKPDNVVLNILTSPQIVGNYLVKLVDFGTSKTQVQALKTTSTEHGFGTLTHKAPEVRYIAPGNDRKWKAIWFKADVWSFAITCSQILSLEFPVILYEDLMKGLRPKLSTGYGPHELIALLDDCRNINPRSRPDFLQICTRLEILRFNHLRGFSTSDQGLQEVRTDSTSHEFIQKKLKEHFRIDDEAEESMPHVTDRRHLEQGHLQKMTRKLQGSATSSRPSRFHGQHEYYAHLVESITRSTDLIKGGTLEFNESLCKHLTPELLRTKDFLVRGIMDLIGLRGENESLRVALVQLYSVVKQAETLVQMCCESRDSPWPERAFMLLAIKEDILDILLHLRWWTSILDIVIVSTQKKSYAQMVEAEVESLKRADQVFETMLDDLSSSNNELQEAALKDKDLLLNKVVEFQRSCTSESTAYLLSIQIFNLLTDEDSIRVPQPNEEFELAQDKGIGEAGVVSPVGWRGLIDEEPIRNPRLNEFEVAQVIGMGAFGVVSQVEWCGFDCALKTVHINNLPNVAEIKEARILKSFHHPHIVQFFHYWEAELDHTAHIFMEKMSSDLAKHIADVRRQKLSQAKNIVGPDGKPKPTSISTFSNPVAIDILLQVAKAAWHMHSRNVVHRDLNTYNILVRPVSEDMGPELFAQGYLQVKVGDFTTARDNITSSSREPLTPMTGTTLFMSPETFPEYRSWEDFEGENNDPHKVDSWTFGIMCAHVVSGLLPFSEQGFARRRNWIAKLKDDDLRPWIPETCPDYLKFCIESCWKYDPKERPRFSDIWRMLRFARLRSLGLVHDNSDLFQFKDGNDLVVELPSHPTSETR